MIFKSKGCLYLVSKNIFHCKKDRERDGAHGLYLEPLLSSVIE